MTQALEDKDIAYCIVAGRFADLQHEVAAILRTLPKVRVITDRRVRERRQAQRSVAIDRRKGSDRRLL